MAVATAFPVIVVKTLVPAAPDEVMDALSTLRTRDMRSGWLAYVHDQVFYYRLDQQSALPPTPPTVVPAFDGGNWIQLVGGSPTGLFPPLSRILYMDGNQALPPGVGDGSIARPYGTIQEAFDFIAAQPVTDTYWDIEAIVGAVAEVLVSPPHRKIALSLTGNADSVGIASFTWQNDLVAPGTLVINGGTITGNFVATDGGVGAFGLLGLDGTIVNGDLDGTAHTGLVGLAIRGGNAVHKVNFPTAALVETIDATFLGDVTILGFDRVEHCELGDPAAARTWTVTTVGGTPPGQYGLIDCRIDGPGPGTFVLSGPAGCGRMNQVTNFFWLRGAGVGAFAGAATKVLIETGLLVSAHGDNAGATIAVPEQPTDAVLVHVGPVLVNPGEKVQVFARVFTENVGLEGTLNLAITATPTAPPGPAVIIDATQDQVPATNDRTTTLAGMEFKLPPQTYVFALLASKTPVGATPSVPGVSLAPAAVLTVNVVDT